MLFWHSPRLFFPARRSSKFVKAKTMPNLKKVVWAVLNSRDGNSQLARLLTLVRWYERQGFSITGTRKFAHLPFVVCFMEKSV